MEQTNKPNYKAIYAAILSGSIYAIDRGGNRIYLEGVVALAGLHSLGEIRLVQVHPPGPPSSSVGSYHGRTSGGGGHYHPTYPSDGSRGGGGVGGGGRARVGRGARARVDRSGRGRRRSVRGLRACSESGRDGSHGDDQTRKTRNVHGRLLQKTTRPTTLSSVKSEPGTSSRARVVGTWRVTATNVSSGSTTRYPTLPMTVLSVLAGTEASETRSRRT